MEETGSNEEQLSNQIPNNDEEIGANINKDKFIKCPKMTKEKIIRLIIVVGGTIFMIINFFTGIAISHYDVECMDDMTQKTTSSINDFFYEHTTFNMIVKFILSLMIDLIIIYTLIVWSIFGTNLRFMTTGLSYMLLNFTIRFIHIAKQPEQSAFTVKYIFSFFVNYQSVTYSFYNNTIGILIICAFEWYRSNNRFMFILILIITFLECLILIVMQGNYLHEIFTSAIFGHYLFMINEKLLSLFFGETYLSAENNGYINVSSAIKDFGIGHINNDKLSNINSDIDTNEDKDQIN